jgi:hypothetical protein
MKLANRALSVGVLALGILYVACNEGLSPWSALLIVAPFALAMDVFMHFKWFMMRYNTDRLRESSFLLSFGPARPILSAFEGLTLLAYGREQQWDAVNLVLGPVAIAVMTWVAISLWRQVRSGLLP